jgi:hypothetical protein
MKDKSNMICCLFINNQNDFKYAIALLKNGFSSLRIAKTENDSLFDEILIKQHLNNQKTVILSINFQNLANLSTNTTRLNKIEDIRSIFPSLGPSEKEKSIIFFDISRQYKNIFYFITTSCSIKKSNLFNFLTRIKISLNLRLHFSMKFFLNKFENFVKSDQVTREKQSFL